MKCDKCNKEFEDKELQRGHDIPIYCFKNKNEADKFGRHWLCKECHDKYDMEIIKIGIQIMIKNSNQNIKNNFIQAGYIVKKYFFKEVKKENDTTTTK